MGERSGINWTNHSFSPWIGCSKVSPACANCYAERDWDKRYKRVVWGPHGTRRVAAGSSWRNPVRWDKRQAELESGSPVDPLQRPRVFCSPLADIFEDWKGPMLSSQGTSLNDQWLQVTRGRRLSMDNVRVRLFELIHKTPHLNWLLLTKRPENARQMIASAIGANGAFSLKNVWLGASVENQEFADKRIPELLKCRDISPVLFLSCEPLLGPLRLDYPDSLYPHGPQYCCSGHECGCYGMPSDPPAYLNSSFGGVDWVIAGGESGPNPRASDPNWFRSLRDQCKTANVPFFFKQWGEIDEHGVNIGKANAGRLLDGVLHDEFPKVNR